MKKEVEELRKKLKERGTIEANRAFEMEELEINLRASVEELQAKVCVTNLFCPAQLRWG